MWQRIVKRRKSWWFINALYGDYSIWVRPLSMFTESISTSDDREVERFKLVQAL